jgi:hypothetical protein
VTRIHTQSTQQRATSAGSVDRGWRVVRIPTRVGTYARVPRDGAATGDGADATGDGADAKGDAR